MGFFAGFSSAAIALVASQAPEERIGYTLGWLGTGQLVGSLVGPLIGSLIADLSGSYRLPYFCTSATLLVAMVALWPLVPEEFSKPHKDARKASPLASMLALVRSPALLTLFFVLLMAQFGVKTVQPMITLYVRQMVGDVPAIATLAGVAFSITGVANIIAAPFLGSRSDRLGYRRVLSVCLAGGVLRTLPQGFTDNHWLFVGERFALGLFIGGMLPAPNAMVARSVNRSDRGAFGMTSSATFLGNSLGPLLGGGIAAGFGLQCVFVMTAVVMAVNLVWVHRRVPEYGGRQTAEA